MKKYIFLFIILALSINLGATQIGTKQIKDSAITTVKIDDAAVTDTKLSATLKATIDGKFDAADSTLFLWDTDDVIQDTHIDWGTGASQVSAVDVPIADAGDFFKDSEVETVLQKLGNQSALINGTTLRPITLSITSDGSDITASLSSLVGTTITYKFSDGETVVDVTTPDTALLTAGTDTIPVVNYLYVLQSDPTTLVNSTVGFASATELCAIGKVICQSAITLQSDGPLKQHTWTDDIANDAKRGHLSHINGWIRDQWGTWESGVATTFSGTGTGTIGYASTSGKVRQLHRSTFPAFSDGCDLYCVDDPDTPYRKITNIADLLKDSDGDALKDKAYGLVFWGAMSDDSQSKIFINLSSGVEGDANKAREDKKKLINYSIPSDYKGVGFLIYRLIIKNNNDTTWTLYVDGDGDDLRGQFPNTGAGSSTAFGVDFPDGASGFTLYNVTDSTKEVQADLSGITTGNTRTITFPDADVDLGRLNELESTDTPVFASINIGSAYQFPPDIGTSAQIMKVPAAGTVLEWGSGGAGYTNLTEFVDQTAWRFFYSNADSDVVEFAFGADGTFLESNGADTTPVWSVPAGGGDVVGPAGATDDHIATFDTTTGKLIQDGGSLISDLIAKSIGTTKGDIIVFTASATPIRLGVGDDDQILTAASGEASGIKWAAPAAGGDNTNVWKNTIFNAFRIGGYVRMIDGFANDFTVEYEGIDTALSDTYLYSATGDYYFRGNVASPVSQWKMNDDAADTTVIDSVGSNTGTSNNNTNTMSVVGKINDALEFDTTVQDYISFGDVLNIEQNDFSFSLWFSTPSGIKPVNEIIIEKRDGTDRWTLYFHRDDETLQLVFGDGTTLAVASSTADQFNDGAWHNAVGVIDYGNNLYLYVDGEIIQTTDISTITNAQSNSNPLVISTASNNLGDTSFNGKVDEIRVYDIALTPAQILAIYNLGSGTEEENPALGNMELYTSTNIETSITPVTVKAMILSNSEPTSVKVSRVGTGSTMTSASLDDSDVFDDSYYSYNYSATVSGETSDTCVRAFVESDDTTIHIHSISITGFE